MLSRVPPSTALLPPVSAQTGCDPGPEFTFYFTAMNLRMPLGVFEYVSKKATHGSMRIFPCKFLCLLTKKAVLPPNKNLENSEC